jgi:hypothetical protein
MVSHEIYAFFIKQVLRTIVFLPDPHSISSGLLVRRIFLYNMPLLIVMEAPLTFKSLMTVILSPWFNSVPLLSLTLIMLLQGLISAEKTPITITHHLKAHKALSGYNNP